jgi:hypothetical protein
MQSIQAYTTGPQVPPGRTTPIAMLLPMKKNGKKDKNKTKKRSVDLI